MGDASEEIEKYALPMYEKQLLVSLKYLIFT